MGRMRKPAEIRRLTGIAGRHGPAIEGRGAPQPLPELCEDAERLFHAIINAMPPSLYSSVDSQALSNFCHQCILHHRMIAETNEPDFTMMVPTERGMTANPILRVIGRTRLLSATSARA
jgi:hypothetical protein